MLSNKQHLICWSDRNNLCSFSYFLNKASWNIFVDKMRQWEMVLTHVIFCFARSMHSARYERATWCKDLNHFRYWNLYSLDWSYHRFLRVHKHKLIANLCFSTWDVIHDFVILENKNIVIRCKDKTLGFISQHILVSDIQDSGYCICQMLEFYDYWLIISIFIKNIIALFNILNS